MTEASIAPLLAVLWARAVTAELEGFPVPEFKLGHRPGQSNIS